MKRLIYLSILFFGLLLMSCSKDTDGIHASIVGIWSYSSGTLYSDGNLVPASDSKDYLDLGGITFEFQEGGIVIMTYSSFPIPLSGAYTFDKNTGALTISITIMGEEQASPAIYVQKLTKSEMVLVETGNTDEYYKDGEWLIEAGNGETHTIRTETTFKRQ